jgi:hypothetical protein
MDQERDRSGIQEGLFVFSGQPTRGPRARDLRGRLVAALGTSEPAVIAAAIGGYVGAYRSVDEYVRARLGEFLPPGFGWLLACIDPAELRRCFEAEVVRVWTIPADDGGVLVFEGDLAKGAG